MLAHIEDARSAARVARMASRRAITLGAEGDEEEKAITSADYMPAKGEKKRWAIPLLVGAAAGAAAVGLACTVSK